MHHLVCIFVKLRSCRVFLKVYPHWGTAPEVFNFWPSIFLHFGFHGNLQELLEFLTLILISCPSFLISRFWCCCRSKDSVQLWEASSFRALVRVKSAIKVPIKVIYLSYIHAGSCNLLFACHRSWDFRHISHNCTSCNQVTIGLPLIYHAFMFPNTLAFMSWQHISM